MTTVLDGAGYLIILGIFFGFPLAILGYGVWVALVRGIHPPMTETPPQETAPPKPANHLKKAA